MLLQNEPQAFIGAVVAVAHQQVCTFLPSTIAFPKAVLTFVLSLWVIHSAEAAQVSWSDDVCKFTISFDTRRVDQTALQNTVRLLFGGSELRYPRKTADMYRFDLMSRADLPALERECSDILQKGESLKLLPLQGIEEYRKLSLLDVEEWCQLQTSLIKAIKTPSALREYKPAEAVCLPFIEALEGTRDLDTVWRDTVSKHCARNGNPTACIQRSQNDVRMFDGVYRKKWYLLAFGWNNCAVSIQHIKNMRQRIGEAGMVLQDKLKRQFKVVKSDCDQSNFD